MTTTTTTHARSPTPPRTRRSRPSTPPCGPAGTTPPSSTRSSDRSAASSSRPSTCSSGQRVLDVAAGTGTSALPAARRGAEVTATDLTPELLDVGRAAAAAEGLELTWQTADAEALPYADAEFDVVLSAIGVMFAPHHQQAADELVRVCRPGGTIGVLSWTPEGFIGQLFATMKPYAPPPPPGASPAPLWGRADHVREPVRGPGERPGGPSADAAGRPLRRRGGVPRLLQDQLRPDHRGVPLHRRRPREGRRRWTPTWPRWATGSSHDGVMGWEYLLVTARRV